jgi:plastocyanin
MEGSMRRNPMTLALLVCLAALIAAGMVGCSGSGSGGGVYGGGTAPAAGAPAGGAATAASGTPTSGGPAAGDTTIAEQNFAFVPSRLTVKVGETVTFVNDDPVGHNVRIGKKDLGVQNQGEVKTWKASKAGAFPFSCIIHPSMTGEITVQ